MLFKPRVSSIVIVSTFRAVGEYLVFKSSRHMLKIDFFSIWPKSDGFFKPVWFSTRWISIFMVKLFSFLAICALQLLVEKDKLLKICLTLLSFWEDCLSTPLEIWHAQRSYQCPCRLAFFCGLLENSPRTVVLSLSQRYFFLFWPQSLF